LSNPYIEAYPFLKERRGVWKEIARVVAGDVGPASTVVELGAGYCDFINQFPGQRKFAFDLNPEMEKFSAPNVEFILGDAIELEPLGDSSVDFVFTSNFLEHLPEASVHRMLESIKRVLVSGGRFALVQPNFALCEAHYFDDPTHVSIFTDQSVRELFEKHEFHVKKLVAGFLPFSMKSRLPKWPILTRLYLHSPWKPLAAQMYAVAEVD
jgi:SAM-dependent methyltransferase